MDELLQNALSRGASDIHIKTGDLVRARIHGHLVAVSEKPLGAGDVEAMAERIMSERRAGEAIEMMKDHDCSYEAPGLGRFRVNLLRQRAGLMLVLRAIPTEVPSFRSLRLPPVLARLAQHERGMVVVTGVTGSGKSSTQAAIIEFLNQHVRKHILTLENPIEFVFHDKLCSITQREVGPDTESFADGLRAAMRQDPDVILIGEMRDAETMDIAMKAAETGHLVLSTLHTPDAVTTVHRMLAVFPPEEQRSVRIRLTESLNAVVSQRLLPSRSGEGRVLACEILVMTAAIREKIAHEKPLEEIRDLMEEGSEQYGSQTFDQHLARLVSEELVAYETAVGASTNPADFQLRFKLDSRRQEATAARQDIQVESFLNLERV
jgi:twitching motility protein PilT